MPPKRKPPKLVNLLEGADDQQREEAYQCSRQEEGTAPLLISQIERPELAKAVDEQKGPQWGGDEGIAVSRKLPPSGKESEKVLEPQASKKSRKKETRLILLRERKVGGHGISLP